MKTVKILKNRPLLRATISFTLGFLVSLAGFSGAAIVENPSLRGQLLAGDVTANRTLPTTLNMVEDSKAQISGFYGSMSPYAWWALVIVAGVILSLLCLKLFSNFSSDDW